LIKLTTSIEKLNHGFCIKVQDDSSISRQKRAVVLPKTSKNEFLSLLADVADAKYPIYMTGNLKDIIRTPSLEYSPDYPLCHILRSNTLHTMYGCNRSG
jgi:hypothetical protein